VIFDFRFSIFDWPRRFGSLAESKILSDVDPVKL